MLNEWKVMEPNLRDSRQLEAAEEVNLEVRGWN